VPDTPDRTEGQDTFVTKAYAFNDWFAPFQAWLETVLDYIVDAIAWVEDRATVASTSATAAANSATGAANSANFKGTWSSLTGALNKPAQVLHNGAYWQLLNNLANVTTSEPSPSNADWAFSSGTRWVTPYTASATLAANSFNTVMATTSASNMTLPSVAINDFVVVHNSPSSTQTVKLINASYTIRSKYFTASAGDDCILAADEIFYAKCVATNILEIVSQ
jgi:hypothetical protein